MIGVVFFSILVVGIRCQTAVSECGKSVNCFRLPTDCESHAQCNAVFMWTYMNGTFDMVIATSKKWVSAGQNTEGKQNAMDAIMNGFYCFDNGGNTKSGYLTTSGYTPNFKANLPNGVEKPSVSVENGILSCRFKLSGDMAMELMQSKNRIAVLASGSNFDSDYPSQHEHRGKSSAAINWGNNSTQTPSTTTSPTSHSNNATQPSSTSHSTNITQPSMTTESSTTAFTATVTMVVAMFVMTLASM